MRWWWLGEGGGGAKEKKTHKDDSFLYVFARGNVCLLGVMWFKSQKQERDAGARGGSYMCSLFNYYYYYYFVISCKRLADDRFLFTL